MQPNRSPYHLAIVNKWGNVDLSKVKLSKRYEHVRGKRLQPLCRKLKIKYCSAIVGWWDGGGFPIKDGVVVSSISAPKLRQAIMERDKRLELKFIKNQPGEELALLFIQEMGGELRRRGFEVGRRTPPMRVFAGRYEMYIQNASENEIYVYGRVEMTSQSRRLITYSPKTEKGRLHQQLKLREWDSKFPDPYKSFSILDPNSWDSMVKHFEQLRLSKKRSPTI